jgi:hypothetical protein
VSDASVVVSGKAERVAVIRQVVQKQGGEAREVASHGLREHVDVGVGDGVEVGLSAVVLLQLGELGRVGRLRDHAICLTAAHRSPELLFQLGERGEVLVELLLLGGRELGA